MRQIGVEDLKSMLNSADQRTVDRAFQYLYQKLYTPVRNYILSKNGQIQDADDILQEALIVFYKMARQQKLTEIENMEHYLFTICKHLWYKKLKKKSNKTELDDSFKDIPENPVILNHLMANERAILIDQILKTIGHDCRELLLKFYYDRLSMKEILTKMHYSSEAALKNKKSKCMKKLRELFISQPSLKDRLK